MIRVALVAYLGFVILLMLFENRLVFHPVPYPVGDWQPRELQFEDAELTAEDGTALHGWYVPHPKPRAVALFLHGNAGNIAGRAEFLRRVNALGVSVLALDYRGYGRSAGSPTEAGVIADGRAARAWLAAKTGTPEKELLLWGESLGCGVAVELAADGARGMILEHAFTSLPDVAAHHYSWVPVRLAMRNRLRSIDKIAQYKGPLLQAHGDRDSVIPYELGRRLFEAANEPKEFITIPNGDHNDPRSLPFWEAADRFLDRL
ncbi:MAG: alpha/beta hydrolase [Pirellulales bacterium]